jgi:hypothetical protein
MRHTNSRRFLHHPSVVTAKRTPNRLTFTMKLYFVLWLSTVSAFAPANVRVNRVRLQCVLLSCFFCGREECQPSRSWSALSAQRRGTSRNVYGSIGSSLVLLCCWGGHNWGCLLRTARMAFSSTTHARLPPTMTLPTFFAHRDSL